MRIAILSDTHGDQAMVARALKLLTAYKVDCILHCGDIDDPQTVHLFTGTPTHFVLGNCDMEPTAIATAAKISGGKYYGRFADLELGGKRIAMLHGDDKRRMNEVERAGVYDYLFYGHTHQQEQHRTGRTLVVNPGALHRARPKTFVLLDLESGILEYISVAG